VLSVGLAPGVTNLLARHCADRSGGAEVRIGVLLGAGERYGPASIEWTLDGFATIGPASRMRFPPPYGTRTVFRSPTSTRCPARSASIASRPGCAWTRAP
jgi:hypothetical protein